MGKVIKECDCNILHKEIYDLVSSKMEEEIYYDRMVNFYKVFSDSTRIKIISALLKHEMCVCDIAVLLNMTKSAISHQLKYLKNNKVIKDRKLGKHVFYSLLDSHISDIYSICLSHVKE